MPDLEIHFCEICGSITILDDVIEIRLRNQKHLWWGGKKAYWLCSPKCVKEFIKRAEQTPYGIMVEKPIENKI